jgi:hypothetical protein
MSLVRASSQAMYRDADTVPLRGIGSDLFANIITSDHVTCIVTTAEETRREGRC